jgi:hypothetical protein
MTEEMIDAVIDAVVEVGEEAHRSGGVAHAG